MCLVILPHSYDVYLITYKIFIPVLHCSNSLLCWYSVTVFSFSCKNHPGIFSSGEFVNGVDCCENFSD